MIIGLFGVAGAGKDEVGQVLTRDYGFQRRAFADKMKAMSLAINPWIQVYAKEAWALADVTDYRAVITHPIIGVRRSSISEPITSWPRYIRLAELVDLVGLDLAKKHVNDVRVFFQRIGTEGGRVHLGVDVWVEAAVNHPPITGHVAFTDCRFNNEAAWVANQRGQLWKVSRPGFEPLNDHASEHAWAAWVPDFEIHNDGTLADLNEVVHAIMGEAQVGASH